jgi:hypothetical protein
MCFQKKISGRGKHNEMTETPGKWTGYNQSRDLYRSMLCWAHYLQTCIQFVSGAIYALQLLYLSDNKL